MIRPPTVVVVVRHPRPGSCLTHLIGELGTHGAAVAQHRLTLRAVDAAVACGATVLLLVSGDAAATAALYPGRRIVTRLDPVPAPIAVVGTDGPSVTADGLTMAFDRLRSADLVIGPIRGGRCYLVAMSQFEPDVLAAIGPSGGLLSGPIRQAADRHHLTVAELPEMEAVGVAADLRRLRPAYAPGRIAVTGATGAIGTRFLGCLLRDLPDLRVTALVRSARPPRFRRLLDRYGSRISLVEQDLCALSLSRADRRRVGESDGLWHFAADTALAGRDAAVWAANDLGTAALLDLLDSVDAPGPLLHLSTAYVCGTAGGTVREADLPTDGFRNAYEASKASAERRVRSALAAGLTGCVFRPSVVVEDDPADASPKMVDVVAAAASLGPVTLRLPATASLNLVHVDWVLAAMSALAAAPAGQTFHLTARQPVRLADLPGVTLDPAISPRQMSRHSRLLDRAVDPFRPYLSADVRFDRSAFAAACPELAGLTECDPAVVLAHRARHCSDAAG